MIQYESEVGAVNSMLTTRRVALASLLVIAHLVHNGKERERDGWVPKGDGYCVHEIVSVFSVFIWQSVTAVVTVRKWW